MSRDTWGQQIASMNRRGRFINTIGGWGLATAGATSDRSDDCSLGSPAGDGKYLLHSLASPVEIGQGPACDITLSGPGLEGGTMRGLNIDSNPYG